MRAVGVGDGHIVVVGDHDGVIEAGGAAPVRLHEGQVGADGDDGDVVVLQEFFVEAPCLRVAEARVQAGNEVQHPNLALGVVDDIESVDAKTIDATGGGWSLLADFDWRAEENGEGFVGECDG